MKKTTFAGTHSRPFRIFYCMLFTVLLAACSKETPVTESAERLAIVIPFKVNTGLMNLNAGTVITDNVDFSAIATIRECWGEDVRFFGKIENKVTRFTDANGVEHYSRHWTIKGLSGEGLLFGVPTGTTYTVISGAEMFVISDPVFTPGPNAGFSGKIFIHQGTVILENTRTLERVVARHVVKKHPQTGVVSADWLCMGK